MRVGCQRHAPADLPPGKRSDTRCARGRLGTGAGQDAPPSNAVKNVSSYITNPQTTGRSIKLRDTLTSTRRLNIPATLSTAKSHTAHTGGQLAVSHFTCGPRYHNSALSAKPAPTTAY